MKLNPRSPTQGQPTLEDLTPGDRQAVLEFRQFLKWAKSPNTPVEKAPHRYLAASWYQGLITIEEGKRIETKEV